MSWKKLLEKVSIPVIAAPLFLVSGPELVIASGKAGIIGSFPALNARNENILDDWLKEISSSLGDHPYAVNLIVHQSNPRLEGNLEKVIKYKVPIVITSLGANDEVIKKVHSYGGLVFHDVANHVHAQKAAKAGVDGLILVSGGSGGHSGQTNPFALIGKVRQFFDGAIILAGSLSSGRDVLAVQALGGHFAYMGTRFVATKESLASQEYKEMLVEVESGPSPSFLPTVYTDQISGIFANFLRRSLEKVGLDPDRLDEGHGLAAESMGESEEEEEEVEGEKKAWRDVWSGGHGVMNIQDIPSVPLLVSSLIQEYRLALASLPSSSKL